MNQLQCLKKLCKREKIKFTKFVFMAGLIRIGRKLPFLTLNLSSSRCMNLQNKDETTKKIHVDADPSYVKELHRYLPELGFSAYTNVGFSTKYLGRKYLVSLFNWQVLSPGS